MKLYDLPRDKGIKIKAESFNEQGKKLGDFLTFHHIDGMYSYCTVDGVMDNDVVHLSASTELKLSEEGYYELTQDEGKI